MPSRAELVRQLAEGLQPVRRTLPPFVLAAVWLAGAWISVTVATLATGSMRPGFASQLAESPRFLAEVLLGLLAGAAAIYAMGRLGVPSPRAPVRQAGPALLLMAGWVGAYLYGLLDPSFEPSMLGKRETCAREVLILAAPPLAAALWLVRRAAPLARVWTGALAGAAAAAVPGLIMQLACMYEPAHILTHHLAPIGVAAFLGALLGRVALRRL